MLIYILMNKVIHMKKNPPMFPVGIHFKNEAF